MKLKVAGCSGSSVRETFLTTLVVNDAVLLDAGAAASGLTLPEQARVTDIFLTHSHLDHVGDLLFLADNLVELICQDACRPVLLHATEPVLEHVGRHLFNNTVWPDFTVIPSSAPVIQPTPLVPGEPVRVGGLELTGYPVNHTPGACGYVVRDVETGSNIAFTGDTGVTDDWWEALNARGEPVDSLIVEVSFPSDREELAGMSHHLTPALLREELRKLDARPSLYVTHMKHTFVGVIIKELQDLLSDRDLHFLHQGDVFYF